jgi:hypothetical protein
MSEKDVALVWIAPPVGARVDRSSRRSTLSATENRRNRSGDHSPYATRRASMASEARRQERTA